MTSSSCVFKYRAVRIGRSPATTSVRSWTNSEIVITKEALPESTYTLPCKDPKMEEYLTATRFIRSDNDAIIQ